MPMLYVQKNKVTLYSIALYRAFRKKQVKICG